MLDVLFASDADVLLLDEPDNFLDVPAKLALEQRIRSSKKTIVMISHDRAVLAAALGAIVTLEGNGAWVHGESYATYAQAREDRQRRLGDAVKRWHEEERRLFRLMKTFKERAATPRTGPSAPTRWRHAGTASALPVRPRRQSPIRPSPSASTAVTRHGSCSTCGRWRSPTSSRRSPTRSTSASGLGYYRLY